MRGRARNLLGLMLMAIGGVGVFYFVLGDRLSPELRQKNVEKALNFQTRNVEMLEENKKKENVQVTESGLQYRELQEGTGATPEATDQVTVHYQGTLADGTVFDSSYQRGQPTQFPVNGLIRGWTEALLLMKEGDKWELVVPPDLAYGSKGAGNIIPPNATLTFEVELIKVN